MAEFVVGGGYDGIVWSALAQRLAIGLAAV